jgi:type 1 glutamine amidotransferase
VGGTWLQVEGKPLNSTIILLFRKSVSRLIAAGCLAVTALAVRAPAQTPFKVMAFFRAGYDAAHINYAHEANRWFPSVAKANGFTFDSTKNWDLLNDPTLINKYQVIMFMDDQPSSNQRAGFQKYMEAGGGFIGFHVSAFTTNSADWDWYHNKFLGSGNFRSNTWGPTSAIMKVEDTGHPVTNGFPVTFKSEVSEWYNWTNDLRKNPDIKVLCSIDPSSYPLGTDPNQSWRSGDNPIVWTNKKYKMIYCNSGHNDMDYAANTAKSYTFANAQHCTLILNALKWLAGQAPTSIHGDFANAGRNPAMEIRAQDDGLMVSRTDAPAFGIAILDMRGNILEQGRAENGRYLFERTRLAKGAYLIRTQAAAGAAARTVRVP